MRLKYFFLIFLLAMFACKKGNKANPVSVLEDVPITPESTAEVSKKDTTPVIPIEFNLVGDTIQPFEGEILLNQSRNAKFNDRKWQGIPSIETYKDGTIYIVWYTGGAGEVAGNYITVNVSKDKGRTWLSNAIIINPTVFPLRFFDPCIWKDQYGEISVSWSKTKNNWDGKGGVFYSRIRVKDSIEFSRPRFLANGVMMNKPLLSLNKTTILYPISAWSTTPGTFIYESKIPSNEWKLASTIDIPKTIRNVDEHQIIQLNDGSYFLLFRGIDALYFTKSKDLKNWDVPEKFQSAGPTNAGRFSLSRLRSGKVALVMNNATNRSNMTIFLSDDECNSWKYKMLLDERVGVSYPDLTEDNDGNIYVVYDYDRYKAMDINFLSFTESNVINNQPSLVKKQILH